MSRLIAFLRLVRWVNLLFILLAQGLFRYIILVPVFHYYGAEPALSDSLFALLALSTVLIAAGGYIINDYFDIKIDQVNKPGRMVVDRLLSRRRAMLAHWLCSGSGIVVGVLVALAIGRWHLAALHIGAAILLWFYSTNFKRMPLVGNIVVAFLTGLVIAIVALFEIWILHRPEALDAPAAMVWAYVLVYGGFAFLISMVREIVKDIEDLPGDAGHHAITLPVAAGVRNAKVVASGFGIGLLVLAVLLLALEDVRSNIVLVLYGLMAVVLPMLAILFLLVRADRQTHYRTLSALVKSVMLAGILSMLAIYFSDHPVNLFPL